MDQKPSVGQIVHYVSLGSADGQYPSTCRAATITEVSEIDDREAGVPFRHMRCAARAWEDRRR